MTVLIRRVLRMAILATIALWPWGAVSASGTGGTINYKVSIPFRFVDSSVVVWQGTPVAGGCDIPIRLEHHAGELPVGAVELSFDPSTCQETVLLGHVDPKSLTSPNTTCGCGGGSVQSIGSFEVYWEDPAYIHVTDVTDYVTWDRDGTYVDNVVSAYDTTNEYQNTGWQLLSHSEGGGYYNSNQAYEWQTYAEFYNYPFCGGTWVYYNPQQLNVFGNGTDSGYANTYDSGCDASWLHFYSILN